MGLRVLHLIDSGGLYGAERMLLTLVQEQIKQGLQPMILSAGDPRIEQKPLEAEANRLGLPVVPWRLRPGLNLAGVWRLLQWAKRNKYDVLHCHGYKFSVLLAILPRYLRGLPMVRTMHGYTGGVTGSRQSLYETLDRTLLRRSDAIVTVTQAASILVAKHYAPSAKLAYIPNGIALAAAPEAVKLPNAVAQMMASADYRFLAIGRLSTEKAFHHAIAAIAALKNNGLHAALVIAGEGALYDSLIKDIRHYDVADRVRLLGYWPDAAALMPLFDCLLVPSLREGLPITVLEALRARLPMICTRVGALPDVLQALPSAVLVNPDDRPALVQAMSDAMGSQVFNADASAERGYKRVLGELSAERMAGSYNNLYREVCVSCPIVSQS